MKTPILTAAVLGATLLAVPALAQQRPTPPPAGGAAAATLPDAFGESPAPNSSAARPAPRPSAPTRAPAGPTAQAPDIARSEEALRGVIAAVRAGRIDYSVFSPDLARKIRTQSAQMTPLIQQFGPIRTVEHKGQQSGADMFRIVFEKQATEWVIGFNDEDQIAALLFRPAAD